MYFTQEGMPENEYVCAECLKVFKTVWHLDEDTACCGYDCEVVFDRKRGHYRYTYTCDNPKCGKPWTARYREDSDTVARFCSRGCADSTPPESRME